MYKYLITLLIFAIIPGIYFFIRFKEHRKPMIYTILILAVVFIVWEYIAMYYNLWSWNDAEIIGRIFGLPIDEFLYMIFVPLMGFGLYEYVKKYLKKKK
jgi:lycopene cyclase domain-containing protein